MVAASAASLGFVLLAHRKERQHWPSLGAPLLTHLGFGLLLVPFFLTTVSRYGQAPAAHAAADRV